MNTVGELIEYIEHCGQGENWNSSIRNLGNVSKQEVEEVLKQHGYNTIDNL